MTRNDIHSPANFKPEDYSYVGSFDQWPTPGALLSHGSRREFQTEFGTVDAFTFEHALYVGGRKLLEEEGVNIHHDKTGGCDHCGARIRYVSVFRHTPSGQVLAVGSTCAEERFGCESRREYDVKRLKEAAANQRDSTKAMGAAVTFVQAACPELEEWLLTPAAETVHPIFADMGRRLVKWGSLSEKQVAFARKLLAEHFEKQRNGGKTDRQVQIEAEKAAAQDCPRGRVKLTGTVVKTEYRESQYGLVLKMVFREDRGFAVWMTVPSALQLVEVGRIQRGLEKGDRIEVTATLQPSDKDPKFGFGSRPIGKLLPPLTELEKIQAQDAGADELALVVRSL